MAKRRKQSRSSKLRRCRRVVMPSTPIQEVYGILCMEWYWGNHRFAYGQFGSFREPHCTDAWIRFVDKNGNELEMLLGEKALARKSAGTLSSAKLK